MDDKSGWKNWQPTKGALVWTCLGTAVVTMIVGFTWGGWVTGGAAETRAAEAAETGRAELAAAICVERYLGAPDVEARHAAFMEESTWGRDGMIEDAGWTTPLGVEEPVEGAADLCADRLADADLEAQVEEASLGEAAADDGVAAN